MGYIKNNKGGNKKANSHFDFASKDNNLLKSKRSQLTVFIIIGILILVALVFVFLPNLKKIFVDAGPQAEIRSCIKENVEPRISEQVVNAGVEQGLGYMYQGEKYNYLCYTNEWYEKCIMQEPMLLQNIESKIKDKTTEVIRGCVTKVVNDYKQKGYGVDQTGDSQVTVKLVPGSLLVSVNSKLNFRKEGESIEIGLPSSEIKTESYDLIMIATSILNWEARYGDAPFDVYMNYYPNIKVEKYRQSEGTTLYIITNRDTLEKIKFASRSLAMPPGYS